MLRYTLFNVIGMSRVITVVRALKDINPEIHYSSPAYVLSSGQRRSPFDASLRDALRANGSNILSLHSSRARPAGSVSRDEYNNTNHPVSSPLPVRPEPALQGPCRRMNGALPAHVVSFTPFGMFRTV